MSSSLSMPDFTSLYRHLEHRAQGCGEGREISLGEAGVSRTYSFSGEISHSIAHTRRTVFEMTIALESPYPERIENSK